MGKFSTVPAVILGQLIQAGRRFCECRSHDFVPVSDERVVLIAYTVNDEFISQSMNVDCFDLHDQMRSYLIESAAIAYILVKRHVKNLQAELPFPVGRLPMDRITITAATEDTILSISHLLKPSPKTGGYKLISKASVPHRNLFQREEHLPLNIAANQTATMDALLA